MGKEQTQESVLWLVGANMGKDLTSEFVTQGTWEHDREDKYTTENVNAIQVGDHVAIKSTYRQLHNLPFETNGNYVSVMRIKALGTVKENPQDGHKLKVDWKLWDSPRLWYFNTYRYTIQKVTPIDWMKKSLMEFVLDGKNQDIERFRNDPFWSDRFGDKIVTKRDCNRFCGNSKSDNLGENQNGISSHEPRQD